MSVNGRKHEFTVKSRVLLVRNVFPRLLVLVSFTLTEIDNMQNMALIFYAHDEILWFDIPINETSVMQNLNSINHL